MMTGNEHLIKRTEGIEMAAAYRKALSMRGKLSENLSGSFAYQREKACKEIIGEDKYKAGRSSRYKDLIKEMQEEE